MNVVQGTEYHKAGYISTLTRYAHLLHIHEEKTRQIIFSAQQKKIHANTTRATMEVSVALFWLSCALSDGFLSPK